MARSTGVRKNEETRVQHSIAKHTYSLVHRPFGGGMDGQVKTD